MHLLLALLTSLSAQALQLHCNVESVLTQFVAESRGDAPGFYSEGIDQGTSVVYEGTDELHCVQGCVQPKWIVVHADQLTDVAPRLPSTPAEFPRIWADGRMEIYVAFQSKHHKRTAIKRVSASRTPFTARAEIAEKIRDSRGILPSIGEGDRVVTDNLAELEISCR